MRGIFNLNMCTLAEGIAEENVFQQYTQVCVCVSAYFSMYRMVCSSCCVGSERSSSNNTSCSRHHSHLFSAIFPLPVQDLEWAALWQHWVRPKNEKESLFLLIRFLFIPSFFSFLSNTFFSFHFFDKNRDCSSPGFPGAPDTVFFTFLSNLKLRSIRNT